MYEGGVGATLPMVWVSPQTSFWGDMGVTPDVSVWGGVGVTPKPSDEPASAVKEML